MGCGDFRKPADSISDRAHRYRAQQCIPSGPKRCVLCRSRRFLVVDHKDGDEWNDRPSNLRWLCKSCNNREGLRMAKAGKGRRTRQYNSGAKSLGAYVAAASKHRRGTWDAGGKVIHDTPKSKRSEFAREIWALRRQLGTDRFSDFDWETGEKVKRNAKRRKKNPGLLSGALAGAAMGAAKALINPKKKTVRKKRASKNSYRTLPRMIVGEAYKLLRGRGVKITPELKAQVDRGMARGKSASQIANELSRSLKRKRNDGSEAEAAAQAYEDFHGRSASKVLAMQEALMTAGDYWAIGDDPELWLQPNVWK